MQPAERHLYTEDEYVELERRAETKSELVNGEIFAMAGAEPRHNVLAVNLSTEIRSRLRARESPCVVFNSDQRVRSDGTGINTYADVSVARSPRFHAKYRDALVNPTVIVEVLSPTTRDWDTGGKFAHYRRILSLREVLFVSPEEKSVTHHRRNDDGTSRTSRAPSRFTSRRSAQR